MLKGHLEMIVLAALGTGPAHGYAVIEAIRANSSGALNPPEGTIYPALHRLEAAGLLDSHWEHSPVGRRRRVYALTRRGRATLAEQRTTWDRFSSAIGALLGASGRAPA